MVNHDVTNVIKGRLGLHPLRRTFCIIYILRLWVSVWGSRCLGEGCSKLVIDNLRTITLNHKYTSNDFDKKLAG